MSPLYNLKKLFYELLPNRHNLEFQYHPIIYVYDYFEKALLGIYSFDREKEIVYVKNIQTGEYWYISLREFKLRDWQIYDSEDLEKYFRLEKEDLCF